MSTVNMSINYKGLPALKIKALENSYCRPNFNMDDIQQNAKYKFLIVRSPEESNISYSCRYYGSKIAFFGSISPDFVTF